MHTAPLLALVALAQRPMPIAELPFEMVGNRVYLSGSVGGKSTSLILDTGAGMSIFDTDLARRLGAKETGSIPVSGAGDSVRKGAILDNFMVSVTGTNLQHAVRYSVPLDGLASFEGRPLEGILGTDFIQKFVVQIDYQAKRVRLFEPAKYVHPTKAVPHPYRLVGNLPHTKIKLSMPGVGVREVDAMIDTGATGSAILTQRFSLKEDLATKLAALPSVPTGAGVGGPTFGKRTRLDWLDLGERRLERPIAAIEENKGGATGANASYDVLIGGEALRRFTATFDHSRNRLYLDPNREFRTPFVGDLTGLQIMAEGNELRTYRVSWIVANSAAEEAGFRVGDEVVSVDGRAVGRHTLEHLRQDLKLRRDRRIVVRRGDQTIELRLRPRPTV